MGRWASDPSRTGRRKACGVPDKAAARAQVQRVHGGRLEGPHQGHNHLPGIRRHGDDTVRRFLAAGLLPQTWTLQQTILQDCALGNNLVSFYTF